jgi:hypothetical protein
LLEEILGKVYKIYRRSKYIYRKSTVNTIKFNNTRIIRRFKTMKVLKL